MSKKKEPIRDRWLSRPAFVMAAIGSAVGLGNVWRFPYIAYENGGGAFFIPYFVALLTAGIPLLILEFGLGQMMQGSAAASFSKINKRWEWVGWWAILTGAIIVFYYSAITAWCLDYMIYSINVAWGDDAKGFFFQKFLQLSSGPGELGGIRIPVVIALALIWLSIFLILHKGLGRVGKVVMVTVPLPLILIAILVIRGITLPGAMDGLTYYLQPDFGRLKETKVWLAAYSQVFFSLSIGFGIMIAYASHLPKNSEITNNAFITSFANCGTSFFAGFAVFSTMGYLAHTSGVKVEGVVDKGLSLAFVTYPTAIALIPFSAFFGAIFFLTLLTLAIDSAFSLVEAVSTGVSDKWHISKKRATTIFCIIGFLASLLFATRGGLFWLDIVDHWMASYGLVGVGLLECLIIGYFFKTDRFVGKINSVSEIRIGTFWKVCIRFITPAILIIILSLNLIEEFKKPYEGYPSWSLYIGGWGLTLIVLIIAVFLMLYRGKEEG